ncbi:hypothetical protein [Thermonema rossianum]|uniref:hypothetical protein n=1 Tax=Thermonema rossianum TaxID=55505 RepID=UPI00056F69AA|nr:hypothetical protein [Thermonema rossianum]
MQTSFIYFSSGHAKLHNRTILSVLSLLGNYALTPGDRLLIYTDEPAYYEPFLSGVPVEYKLLPEAKIKEMMGPDDLIHRVKIGVIEDAACTYPQNNIFYIDSDTFFFAPIGDLLQKIAPHRSVMHKFEYEMTFLGTYPLHDKDHFRAVYETLRHKTFHIAGKAVRIRPEDFASWNAGIIGLHHSNAAWLREVYELTDQLYESARNHACEQYAFSYVLQKRTELLSCEHCNRHYWHRIEKQIVDEFLQRKLTKEFERLPLPLKIEHAGKWCRFLLKKIPKHPYWLRYSAMIAFQERQFVKGYWLAMKTLAAAPRQDVAFFKDIAYHTKRMLLGK